MPGQSTVSADPRKRGKIRRSAAINADIVVIHREFGNRYAARAQTARSCGHFPQHVHSAARIDRVAPSLFSRWPRYPFGHNHLLITDRPDTLEHRPELIGHTRAPQCSSLRIMMTIPADQESSSPLLGLPELVAAAITGQPDSCNGLVERFTPLVSAVIRKYQLGRADASDVRQNLWLRLVEHIKDLREPRALPGWIVTTTKHEIFRVLSTRRRLELVDPQADYRFHQVDHVDLDEALIHQERQVGVKAGLAELQPKDRQLLNMLFADSGISYREISEQLGIPIGSIGPTRARCLQKLQATTPIRALVRFDDAVHHSGAAG